MAKIAEQIGIFIIALIIVGIPLFYGLVVDASIDDDDYTDSILAVCSLIDLCIVITLIEHCI